MNNLNEKETFNLNDAKKYIRLGHFDTFGFKKNLFLKFGDSENVH